jgi:hypothetical protein
VASQAQAACPTTAGRFVANAAEVADSQTGLIWQRCSAGQSWSGSTCTGSVGGYTHEQALAYAKTQNTTDSATGWRLPNVKELSSLADKGCQDPAIDSTAFPATPSSWYWASSPDVGNSFYAWYVYFGNGYAGSPSNRNYNGAVRLVRASQ